MTMRLHLRRGDLADEGIVFQFPSLLSNPMTVGDTLDLRWVQREEIVKIEDRKFISIK